MFRHCPGMTIGFLTLLGGAGAEEAQAQSKAKAPVTFTAKEVKEAVKKFFEGNGFGYKEVTITEVSKPMTLPESYALAQSIPMKAYSVSFTTQTTFGKRTMDNWFLMLTRRKGKAMVQGYFSSEDTIKKQLGKDGPEWYKKNGVKAHDVHQ